MRRTKTDRLIIEFLYPRKLQNKLKLFGKEHFDKIKQIIDGFNLYQENLTIINKRKIK